MDHQEKYNKRLTQSASRYRDIIINTLGGCCCDCGSADGKMIIHHKKYAKGMTINDVELVCQVCHKKRHLTKDISKRVEDFLEHLREFGKNRIYLGELQFYLTRVTRNKYFHILENQKKIRYVEKKPVNKSFIELK